MTAALKTRVVKSPTISAPPDTTAPDWKGAACKAFDPELWFPVGHRSPSDQLQAAQAKSVCIKCPILAQCDAWAIATRQPYGIWGGRTEEERAEIIRRKGGRDRRIG